MQRKIDQELLKWKNSPRRVPLLVRGGRQVGKTYAIEAFGKTHFHTTVTINFERNRRYLSIFDPSLDLSPLKIVRAIEELSQTAIHPGETLLFFDEIQACPRAIMALRYFKEEMPNLHVIGAGSLLEFSLKGENFSFPVGRVEFQYMYPLSFHEFLAASQETVSLHRLGEISLDHPPSASLHAHLLSKVRDYFRIGGMPAALASFLKNGLSLEAAEIQQMILDSYRSDFGKYASAAQQKYLEMCFDRAPLLVGSRVKYSKIASEAQARDLKGALHLLETAGLIHSVHATEASGLPLVSTIQEKKLKLIFLDIGLLQQYLYIDPQLLNKEDLLQVNAGALAEQFVGQELLVNTPSYRKESLFFWEREKRGSEAEVDYVIHYRTHIIPIEVKAGTSGKRRSLRIFMEEKGAPLGIHISQNPLSFQNRVLSLPLYLLADLPKLLDETLGYTETHSKK